MRTDEFAGVAGLALLPTDPHAVFGVVDASKGIVRVHFLAPVPDWRLHEVRRRVLDYMPLTMLLEVTCRDARETVCGDVDAGAMLVVCECGQLRQHDRAHGFVDAFHAY